MKSRQGPILAQVEVICNLQCPRFLHCFVARGAMLANGIRMATAPSPACTKGAKVAVGLVHFVRNGRQQVAPICLIGNGKDEILHRPFAFPA